jgi:hypothetical protein
VSAEPGPPDVDALLAKLPQWTPPPDFAARLAAAAARQSEAPPRRPMTAPAWLLRRLARRGPVILGAAALALVLAMTPWTTITFNPLFPWIFSAGTAILGSWMALRLIRS